MKRFTLFVVSFWLFVGGAALLCAQDSKESSGNTDVLVINNPVYPDDKMGAVPFTHKVHIDGYRIRCFVCHHDYQEDGANTWTEKDPVKKCTECHQPGEKQGKARTLQGAYHGSCVTCHFALIYRSMSDSAPHKECDGCHQKTQ
jgi:hypothetical protein